MYALKTAYTLEELERVLADTYGGGAESFFHDVLGFRTVRLVDGKPAPRWERGELHIAANHLAVATVCPTFAKSLALRADWDRAPSFTKDGKTYFLFQSPRFYNEDREATVQIGDARVDVVCYQVLPVGAESLIPHAQRWLSVDSVKWHKYPMAFEYMPELPPEIASALESEAA